MEKITYHLDRLDTIVAAGGDWDKFSLANNGSYSSDSIIGQSLWPFIQGADVRQLYRSLFAKARSGHPLGFYFRCDSPTIQRKFFMKIFSLGEKEQDLGMESTLDSLSDYHGPAVQFEAKSLLRACCVCNFIFYESRWLDVEKFIQQSGYFMGSSRVVGVTHTYCRPCYEKAMAGLKSAKLSSF